MATRKNELSQTRMSGAAHQINTFVAGPRVARTNTALQLSEALGDAAEAYQEIRKFDTKINVEQATESKLFGGTLFTNESGMATSGYEEVKGNLDTMEKAQAWYLETTAPKHEIEDAHTLAGYREAQSKGLGQFLERHGQFLTDKRIEARTRDTLNDFLLTAGTDGIDTAFSRLGQISSNYGMDIKETNKISLGAAEYLISQERFKDAEAILNYKRGPAGSLITNPATALEAQKFMAKVQTEDSITTANQLKAMEDATEASSAFSVGQKAILDDYLKRGVITVSRRNEMLQANEKAIEIDRLSDTLAKNLSEPGRSFFDPVEGVTPEDAEKARKRFTDKFYNDAELKRSKGTLNPQEYAIRNVRFSEQTNTVNQVAKERIGAGFAAFNPNDVVSTGEIDQATLASVGEYALMYKANPNVAAAYAGNEKSRDFYDAIIMDAELGGYQGDQNARIQQALKNYASDAINPLKGSSDIRISDADILREFNRSTNDADGIFGRYSDGASNASQWAPYIKRQVIAASRRTGNSDTGELIKHVTKQIVARSQRIGDYLVPRGTNTFVDPKEDLTAMSRKAVGQYIADNPEDGYSPDELVMVPMVGQQNMWGIAVKGSNQILSVLPHDKLPLSGKGAVKSSDANGEINQIIEDEGVVKNSQGQHVSYNDSLGNLTGGHGHLMTPEERKQYPKGTAIPEEVVKKWLEEDKVSAAEDVTALFGEDLHPEVKSVLTNMAFNMGRERLGEFTQLRTAVAANDYKGMVQSMKQSKWYRQTGHRAKRLVERVEALNV